MADPDDSFPADWQAAGRGLAAAGPRLALRDRLHLRHDGRPEGRHAHATATSSRRPAPSSGSSSCEHHRAVGILPLSHLFEQAPVLFYATAIGAEVRYVRSRNPRIVVEAMRELRATVMVMTPQVLELFWTFLTREVERRGQTARFERARRIARRLPYRLRRLLFRSVHAQFGGELHLLVSAGAYLPPELQHGLGGPGHRRHPGLRLDRVRHRHRQRPVAPSGRRRGSRPGALRSSSCIPETSEILVKGPNVSAGYWRNEEATAASRDADGWYLTGDAGHFDEHGNLVLSGRLRNIIVLPNGLNVYPEDVEAALADHGLTQAVVVETAPGRIEAVVLPPGSQPVIRAGQPEPPPRSADEEAAVEAEIERIVKAANADLSMHQRIAGWRLWPEPDFPRTHTLKIRRNEVRAWAGDDVALKVREADAA